MDRSIFHTKFYSLLTYTTVSNRSKIISLYKQKWLENIYRTHNRIYPALCYKIKYEIKCVLELFFYLVLVCNPVLGSTVYLFYFYVEWMKK